MRFDQKCSPVSKMGSKVDIARKYDFLEPIFEFWADLPPWAENALFLGPKISNQRFTVRVSPNPKNVVFEIENFFDPKSAALNLANFFFDQRPKTGRKKYFSDLRFFRYGVIQWLLKKHALKNGHYLETTISAKNPRVNFEAREQKMRTGEFLHRGI